MRYPLLAAVAVAVAVLSGCAAPLSHQYEQLSTSAACCTELAQLASAGTLGTDVTAALSAQTPLVLMNGKRSPALRFLVPAELSGRQLEVRLAPQALSNFAGGGNAFAPVAITFLAADGTPIATTNDSDLEPGPAQSIAFSWTLWRKVTVPAGAASAVFYSDPVRHGTQQTYSYRFSSLVAAGGVVMPMSGNAKASFKVFGEFSVKAL